MNISPPNPNPPADIIEPTDGFVEFVVHPILNDGAQTVPLKQVTPTLLIVSLGVDKSKFAEKYKVPSLGFVPIAHLSATPFSVKEITPFLVEVCLIFTSACAVPLSLNKIKPFVKLDVIVPPPPPPILDAIPPLFP